MRILYLLLLILCVSAVYGTKADSILALSAGEQQEAIAIIYQRLEWKPQERLDALEPLAKAFAKAGRKDLDEMIWSLVWVDKLNVAPDRFYGYEKGFLENLIREAETKGWKKAKEECVFRLGNLLFNWSRFSEGMEMMMRSYEYLNKHGWTSPYAKVQLLKDLSESYYRFGDYQTSMVYLKESLAAGIPVSSAGYPYKNVNTIGLCHLQLQNIDSAVHYFKASHAYASAKQDSFWMALTTGNIGSAYFKAGQYELALPYLENDYQKSIQLKMYGSAVNASTLLATIELQNGNTAKAEEYLLFAKTHRDTFLDMRLGYYENLYTYHKLKGEGETALAYADSVFYLKRQKERLRDRNVLEQARMKAAYEKYDEQIRSLHAARKQQLMLRNGLFVLLISASVVAYFLIRRMHVKRQAAVRRLREAEAELQGYVRSMLEKNEMIQSLRSHIESQLQSSGMDTDRSTEIAQLTQLNILTEEDWKHFRKLFDVVYPGFLIRLKEKLGDLTPAETRILVLAKLQIPQKEMGDMLGISYNSIRTSRYRLRKKLNLPEEGSLEELVEKI